MRPFFGRFLHLGEMRALVHFGKDVEAEDRDCAQDDDCRYLKRCQSTSRITTTRQHCASRFAY